MGRPIKKDSTDQSTVIRIIDSTTGIPETAVEHDTTGIALWYRREGATVTAITEAALAAIDSAHSDGGIEHIGDGYYRLDLPDAAVATGVNSVQIGGTVTGMVVIGNEHTLTNYDPYDAVRLGLTALPNAAADAAGGLPISDAGGLDMDAMKTEAAEIKAAVITNAAGTDIAADIIAAVAELAKVPKSDSTVSWNATALAAINAEIVDALSTDTIAELAQGIPAATPTLTAAIMLLYMKLRNLCATTDTELAIYNDAGTKIAKATLSDDGTTFTKTELVSGA